MQPLDKNTLFSIFESGDEQVYKENGVEELLNNPLVSMGFVLQGLQTYYTLDLLYKRNYPDEYKRTHKELKYKYYCRLYSYLTRINFKEDNTIYRIGESFDIEAVDTALNELRVYFETREEYEKCAVIKNCIDLLATKVV